MADRILIHTSELQAATDRLTDLLKNTKGELAELYEAVQSMNTMWTGPANDAFRSQFTSDQQEAYALCGTLQKFIQSMQYARNAYDNCESSICDIISGIRI
ncbi:WXG100 family type VII secretion target [Butyricicoccus sp.]|uniref:WXG100 family type VII secretion target n=1 Tax=Butyricicoccus sp. TaxID=2049021 RepID=UPI003F18939D